jgi:hypothetical protein
MQKLQPKQSKFTLLHIQNAFCDNISKELTDIRIFISYVGASKFDHITDDGRPKWSADLVDEQNGLQLY